MAYTYKLDGVDISEYVSSQFSYSEEVSLIGEDTIRLPSFTIELWNYIGMFNKYSPNSMFYGSNPAEGIIKVYDELGFVRYTEKIRDWKYDRTTNKVSITSVNSLDSIFDKTFIYLTSGLTPAEHIRDILILYDLKSYIDYHTFNNAIAIQQTEGLLVDCNYYIDNTTTLINAIQELAEMSGCDCFLAGNQIKLLQHNPDEVIISEIEINYYAIQSLVLYDDSGNIKNQYGYTVNVGEGEYTIKDYEYSRTSRQKYGEQSYSSISLTNSSQITSIALAGLIDAGCKRLHRSQEPRDYLQITIVNSLYKYPFQVMDYFKLETEVDNTIECNVSDYTWQILRINFNESITEIIAARCI